MLTTFSHKAIYAKARAMFGRRLTQGDYAELLRRDTVPDIAAYLKQETCYRDVLAGAGEGTLHRGQLESLVRRARFDRYLRLIRYGGNGGRDFYRYLLVGAEVAELLRMLRLLSAGHPEAYALGMPAHLEPHLDFNLTNLAGARTFPQVLAAVEHTPYFEILAPFAPTEAQPVDLTGCETALQTHYYRFLFDRADREFSGPARTALRQMIAAEVDAANLAVVYRLKRFFHRPQDLIRGCLLDFDTPDHPLTEKLMEATGPEGLTALIAQSRLGRGENREDDLGYIEKLTGRARYQSAMKNIRFSPHTPVVFAAWMTLQEIEAENLTTIIEGVRYQIDRGELATMLIA